jgi:hypothetical protein
MKIAPYALVVAAPFLTACASDGDPWVSHRSFAAAAAPGGSTQLTTLFELGAECEVGPAPQVLIEQDGALGALSVSPASETVVDPEGECDGVEVPATAVFYDARAEPGEDVAIFRELSAGPTPDRVHTAHIRVR